LQRLESIEQFVAEVAPGTAINGQPCRLICHPHPEW
jgi:alpha/beta superfamily hydrolase